MARIPLVEHVPLDYRRLYLFFGEQDFRGIVCVDGEDLGQDMFCGENQREMPDAETRNAYMDWLAETVEEIRSELRELA